MKILLDYDEVTGTIFDARGNGIGCCMGLETQKYSVGIDTATLITLKKAGFDGDEIVKMKDAEVIV